MLNDRSTILGSISNDREIDNLSKSSAEDVVKRLEILKHEHNHKLIGFIKNSTTYLFILLQWCIGIGFLVYIGYFLYLTAKISQTNEVAETIKEMKVIILGASGWIAMVLNKIVDIIKKPNNKL